MVQMKFKVGNCTMRLDDEVNKMTIGYVSLGTKSKSIWTNHDDGVLLKAVDRQCGRADYLDDRLYEDETVVDWDDIAHGIPGKSAVQCLRRYIHIRKQLPYVSPRNNNKIQTKSTDVVQNLSFETNYDEDVFENPSRKKQKISYTDKDHWSPKDSSLLIKLIEVYQGIAPRWNEIAANFTDRSALDCITQWQQLTKSTVKQGKGSWTPEEDAVLKEKRLLYGRKWSKIASHLPGRQGKQCRERYMNNLDPNLLKGEWTEEEDLILIAMQEIQGNKWASISKYLPGRSDNDVKKHWHFAIQQKFMLHGKDTLTHAARQYLEKIDLSDISSNHLRNLDNMKMMRSSRHVSPPSQQSHSHIYQYFPLFQPQNSQTAILHQPSMYHTVPVVYPSQFIHLPYPPVTMAPTQNWAPATST